MMHGPIPITEIDITGMDAVTDEKFKIQCM